MLTIFFPRFFSISDYILHLCKTAVDQNGPQYNHSKREAVPIGSLHFCVAWGLDIGTNLHFHVTFCFEYNACGLQNM
jgi:hypothetical protein